MGKFLSKNCRLDSRTKMKPRDVPCSLLKKPAANSKPDEVEAQAQPAALLCRLSLAMQNIALLRRWKQRLQVRRHGRAQLLEQPGIVRGIVRNPL